mmetsp:Transcript_34572/g.103310  ORF Transcript_34572/g.103310 Transcript_34572/m.103310 type:complete len:279 (+) Transcript_34572:69-905(+)
MHVCAHAYIRFCSDDRDPIVDSWPPGLPASLGTKQHGPRCTAVGEPAPREARNPAASAPPHHRQGSGCDSYLPPRSLLRPPGSPARCCWDASNVGPAEAPGTSLRSASSALAARRPLPRKLGQRRTWMPPRAGSISVGPAFVRAACAGPPELSPKSGNLRLDWLFSWSVMSLLIRSFIRSSMASKVIPRSPRPAERSHLFRRTSGEAFSFAASWISLATSARPICRIPRTCKPSSVTPPPMQVLSGSPRAFRASNRRSSRARPLESAGRKTRDTVSKM